MLKIKGLIGFDISISEIKSVWTDVAYVTRGRTPSCMFRIESMKSGEVSEWSKEHAWKVCVR